LYRTADIGLAFIDRVDKGLAVEGQRDRPPDFGVVKRQLVAVDDQVAADTRSMVNL
jgi:hypothetical protein